MASPAAIAQIYASDIVSGFDVHKPEKMNQLFLRYGDQGLSHFNLLRSLGFEKMVSLDEYGHFEDNRIHEIIKIKSQVVSPGQGNDQEVDLHGDSKDANGYYYPRLYDTVLYPNEVPAYIADITEGAEVTLTIRPYDDSDTIPQVEAGDQVSIISSAFSEGSGQPEGAIRGVWEYENTAQIIKETIGYTGTEMVNQQWYDVTSAGQKIPAYYFLGQTDIDYRFALKTSGALLFNKKTTNASAVDPDTGRAIKTTEGLIPYTRRVGHAHSYDIGSFDVADFDDISLILDQEHVGNYVMCLLGVKLHNEIENLLKPYFADTNINFTTKAVNDVLFNKNESLGASVNFKYLTKSERTFMFKRWGEMTNPKTYGADGYDMMNMGIVLPVNKKKDPVNGGMVESIGVRYRGLGAYSRRMEVWNVGGAGGGLKVTEFDKRDTYMRGHIGGHFRGGNAFVLIDPS